MRENRADCGDSSRPESPPISGRRWSVGFAALQVSRWQSAGSLLLANLATRCRPGPEANQQAGLIPALPSGRPGALRRRAPFRTGRARFRASGSSESCWLAGGVAVGVGETGFGGAGGAVSQTTWIVVRVVASQCSQSRGVRGRSWSASSVLLQVAQRPSLAGGRAAGRCG